MNIMATLPGDRIEVEDEAIVLRGMGMPCRFLVANRPGLKFQAARLVRDVYHKKGYAIPQDTELIPVDVYDANPETTTLVAEYGGQIVSTLRVIPDSPAGLPMDAVYPERLATLRAGRRLPCEIASMVFAEMDNRASYGILFGMFYLAYLTARRCSGGTDFVASVMNHHRAFYKKVLLFDEVDAQTRIGPKSGREVSFVRLNLQTAEMRYAQRYARQPDSSNLFSFFCTERPEVLAWLREQRSCIASMVTQNVAQPEDDIPASECAAGL